MVIRRGGDTLLMEQGRRSAPFIRTTEGALWERPTRLAPTGRYFVTGCLITRRSFSGPFDARMLSFWSSCTAVG